ncbi:hypothetical protein ACFL2A_04790 [Thermodesulfobacteriota bacterium]
MKDAISQDYFSKRFKGKGLGLEVFTKNWALNYEQRVFVKDIFNNYSSKIVVKGGFVGLFGRGKPPLNEIEAFLDPYWGNR